MSDHRPEEVAIELVNTVAWRGDPARTEDRIADWPALTAWVTRVGLLSRAETVAMAEAADLAPAEAERAVADVRDLRETVYGVLLAVAGSTPPAAPDLDALDLAVVDALRHASLRSAAPPSWELTPTRPRDLARICALAVLALLQELDGSRLKRCEDGDCRFFFVDHSRSHSRRWCSSADCGNRERVRRHYARQR